MEHTSKAVEEERARPPLTRAKRNSTMTHIYHIYHIGCVTFGICHVMGQSCEVSRIWQINPCRIWRSGVKIEKVRGAIHHQICLWTMMVWQVPWKDLDLVKVPWVLNGLAVTYTKAWERERNKGRQGTLSNAPNIDAGEELEVSVFRPIKSHSRQRQFYLTHLSKTVERL